MIARTLSLTVAIIMLTIVHSVARNMMALIERTPETAPMLELLASLLSMLPLIILLMVMVSLVGALAGRARSVAPEPVLGVEVEPERDPLEEAREAYLADDIGRVEYERRVEDALEYSGDVPDIAAEWPEGEALLEDAGAGSDEVDLDQLRRIRRQIDDQ